MRSFKLILLRKKDLRSLYVLVFGWNYETVFKSNQKRFYTTVFQKYARLGLPISSRSLLFCTYFIKETNKKVAKIRKKNGVKKKKKKPPIKKLIKSDQNFDELGNIYDHMRDFFKFESSNVKENGKIENEFSCLICLGSGGLWSF